jgi:hypothetical protein
MNDKSEFWKHYENPLWQQKRLRCFERDGFKCRMCGGAEKQLHAHHRYYVSQRKPWEYPDWAIVTLCDPCHGVEHQPQPYEAYFVWEHLIQALTNGRDPEDHRGVMELTSAFNQLHDARVEIADVWRGLLAAMEAMLPKEDASA